MHNIRRNDLKNNGISDFLGSFQPCLSMADVYAAIDGFIAEETEGLTEEDIAEGFTGDTGWYEIQKWEQQTGDDGQPHLVKTPWEYIYADHKLCCFSRQFTPVERHDWTEKRLWEICDGSSDLDLSIPFKRGDIVTVNCELFAPVHHAVLLHVGSDCCGVQIAMSTKIMNCKPQPLSILIALQIIICLNCLRNIACLCMKENFLGRKKP